MIVHGHECKKKGNIIYHDRISAVSKSEEEGCIVSKEGSYLGL